MKGVGVAIIKAETRANKDTARTVIKEFVNELQKDYAVKTKVKNDLQIKTYRNEDGTRGAAAVIIAKGKHGIPLSRFKTSQIKAGVAYTVTYSKGKKIMQHAFIMMMKSGHVGIFIRTGKARLPITQKFGPDVKMLISTPRMMAIHKQVIDINYSKYYKSELKYYLGNMIK